MSCKDSREMWMKQKDEPIRVAQIMGKLWAGGVEMVVFNYYRAIDKSKIAKIQDFVRTVGMGNGIPIKIAGNEKSRK